MWTGLTTLDVTQINKTADRMYALMAICQALCPSKMDEGISTAMKEKFGDQYAKMVRGGCVSFLSAWCSVADPLPVLQ